MTGKEFLTSCWNWKGKNCPAGMSNPGMDPVGKVWPLPSVLVLPESQCGSPCECVALGKSPSDSPGGLTHTNAKTCAFTPEGLACGMAPMPAPFWLHQLPRNTRWSTLFAATYVSGVVGLLLSAVGRAGPPQPLREVSITNPMVLG